VKVLLTGAAGFIGSHVARALVREGQEVHALVLPEDDTWRLQDIASSLHFIRGSILDPSFVVAPAPFELGVHLAWHVEPGKYLHASENKDWVEASLRLARALQTAGCRRFVAAGSCFEYAPGKPPQDESYPTAPSTLYAQSKLKLFHALQSLDLELAWVRFFYLYGPQEDPRRLVPVVINSLLRNQEAKLVPGDRVRDFLHVEDVAGGVCAVARSQLTGAVNVASGVPVTVREIALKIGEMIERADLVKIGALPYPASEPTDKLADNTKLREGPGWTPRYTLEEGFHQTIDWWKNR